jgi:hypothetical protein
MKSQELIRQHAALKHLIKRTGHDPSTHDLEMQSHWARYLCIVTSGFVENAVHIVYGAYIQNTSKTLQTARFARSEIEDVQNPKSGRLVQIASSFDKSWGDALDVFLKDALRGDAINAIMSNRHRIAHGQTSDITVARVNAYLTKIVEVVDFIEAQCGI